MATDVAQKIREAETPPAACASCFGQYVDRRHVDFGAYYDGPVLDGAKGIQIDDLVICEQCLTEAASILGLQAQPELNERLENLGQKLREALTRVERQANVIQGLQLALDNTDAPAKPRARK